MWILVDRFICQGFAMFHVACGSGVLAHEMVSANVISAGGGLSAVLTAHRMRRACEGLL